MNENVDITENNISKEIENTIENYVDPLEELIELDFSDKVDIDKYADVINMLDREMKLKNEEAEEIIKDLGDKYLNQEYLVKLNIAYENIKNFYKQYDPNSEYIKKLSKEENDRLYSVGNFLNKNYATMINGLLFTLDLSDKEYLFLDTVLTKKISYNGTEIFNMIALHDTYLKPWKEEYKKNKPIVFTVDIDINNIVMIYHFLQTYSVKGISKEFENFATLLQKIAETHKIYNAFEIKKERANQNFLNWNSAITPIDNTPEDPQEIVNPV